MENDLFNILEEQAQEREYKRACIVASQRIQTRLGSFLKAADSNDEFESRLNLVGDELDDIIDGAVVQEHAPDLTRVTDAVMAHLRDTYGEVLRGTPQNSDVSPGGERNETEDDDPDEDKLDDEPKMGKVKTADDGPDTGYFDSSGGLDDSDEEDATDMDALLAAVMALPPEQKAELSAFLDAQDQLDRGDPMAVGMHEDTNDMFPNGGYESSVHNTLKRERIAVDTGDTYTQETIDLPAADNQGITQDPSPKMDKANAGDENHTSQKPIDVPSVANPTEQQDVTDHADYTKTLEEYGVLKHIDADTPLQPEFTTAPNTQTFPNGGQAQPVTSKWRVVS